MRSASESTRRDPPNAIGGSEGGCSKRCFSSDKTDSIPDPVLPATVGLASAGTLATAFGSACAATGSLLGGGGAALRDGAGFAAVVWTLLADCSASGGEPGCVRTSGFFGGSAAGLRGGAAISWGWIDKRARTSPPVTPREGRSGS